MYIPNYLLSQIFDEALISSVIYNTVCSIPTSFTIGKIKFPYFRMSLLMYTYTWVYCTEVDIILQLQSTILNEMEKGSFLNFILRSCFNFFLRYFNSEIVQSSLIIRLRRLITETWKRKSNILVGIITTQPLYHNKVMNGYWTTGPYQEIIIFYLINPFYPPCNDCES